MYALDPGIVNDEDALVAWFTAHARAGTGTHPSHMGPHESLLNHRPTPTIERAMIRIVDQGVAQPRAQALRWMRLAPATSSTIQAACLRWLASSPAWLDEAVDGETPRALIHEIGAGLDADGDLLDLILANVRGREADAWVARLAERGSIPKLLDMLGRRADREIRWTRALAINVATPLALHYPAELVAVAPALRDAPAEIRDTFRNRAAWANNPTIDAELRAILGD